MANNEDSKKLIIKGYAEASTMHGIRFFFAHGIIRNIVWLILVIISFALVVIQVKQQFDNYVKSPINTLISIDFPDSLPFPAVMICNSNQFRIQKAYQYQMYDTINSAYGKPRYIVNDSDILKNVSRIFNNNLNNLFSDFGHKIDDMLISCMNTDEAVNCDRNSFVPKTTEYGSCYVYNNKHSLNVSQAGQANALTVYINLAAYEAMAGPAELSSLKVSIFTNDTEPVVSMNAIDIPAGFMSVIGLNYHMENKMVSCVNEQDMIHYPANEYDVYKCKLDKSFDAIEHSCNCTPPYAPTIKNVTKCTIEQYFRCVISFDTSTVKNQSQCKDNCETSGYTTSLSLAKIPLKTMKKLTTSGRQQEKLSTTLDQAMEAFARKDSGQVKKWKNITSRIEENVKKATEAKLVPVRNSPTNPAPTPMQQRLMQSSSIYNNFVTKFQKMFQSANLLNKPAGAPAPPGTNEDVTINSTNLLNGLNYVMQPEQLAKFDSSFDKNVNTTVDLYNGWISVWMDLLTNPSSSSPPDRNPINYFDEMYNLEKAYTSFNMTMKNYADTMMTSYSQFPQDYGQAICNNVISARRFRDQLSALQNDTWTQRAFDYLNDTNTDADSYWLAMNYVTTALFAINLEGGCSEIFEDPRKQATCFKSKFSNSTSSTACSNSSGGQSRGGQSQGGQSQTVECYMALSNNDSMDFFDYLRQNLSDLMNQTNQFIDEYESICQNVKNSYLDLFTFLKEYKKNWNWDEKFYKKNILGLKIYFSDLSIKTITQTEAYSIFDLICDIGGSLGLFLGASILTFFEIMDLVIYGLIFTDRKTK